MEEKMRIAITAEGNNLDAKIDPRFGRAQYILVVDHDGTLLESIDNQMNRATMTGAGIQAAKKLADKNVSLLLTGKCGPNATKALKAAGLEFREVRSGTVREALEGFKRGEIPHRIDSDSDVGAAGRGGGRGRGRGGRRQYKGSNYRRPF
jgi:predicted Fe-Mo cluster-binding NifX family protein